MAVFTDPNAPSEGGGGGGGGTSLDTILFQGDVAGMSVLQHTFDSLDYDEIIIKGTKRGTTGVVGIILVNDQGSTVLSSRTTTKRVVSGVDIANVYNSSSSYMYLQSGSYTTSSFFTAHFEFVVRANAGTDASGRGYSTCFVGSDLVHTTVEGRFTIPAPREMGGVWVAIGDGNGSNPCTEGWVTIIGRKYKVV